MTYRPAMKATIATTADAIAANCPTEPGPEIGAGSNRKATIATSATTTNATAPTPSESDSRPRSLEASMSRAAARSRVSRRGLVERSVVTARE